MKHYSICFALVLALSLMPALGVAKPEVYSGVPLLGTEETPPNASASFGALTAIYDDETNHLYYEFEWELKDDAEATAVHFHGPAPRGESAPPVIDIGPISGKSGKSTGVVVLSESEETDLEAGLWYLNIHSTDFPGGEIRGQLIEMSPLDSAAVYNSAERKLRLKSVMVPGLGTFEADLDVIIGRTPLSFELDHAHPKEMEDDAEDAEDKNDGSSG